MKTKLIQTKDYLLLIDEEAEIKDKEIVTDSYGNVRSFADLSFLGLGYDITTIHKVVAYHPLTEEAKELDLPLLPPFEEVDVEKLALKTYHIDSVETLDLPPFENTKNSVEGFIEGYKAAQSKQFSLEDMQKAFEAGEYKGHCEKGRNERSSYESRNYNTFKEFIQSLSTQQLPKEFEPIMYPKYTQYDGFEEDDEIPVMTPMTSTNSEGKEELVGTYKYC